MDLTGKTVQSIWIEDGEANLLLKMADGDVCFSVEGDCCSESWFADFTGVDTLLGQTILAFEETPMPDEHVTDGRSRQEYDSLYGYRFTTARGHADLIFRNSSNGYYGGWMVLTDVRPSGKLTQILGDWSA